VSSHLYLLDTSVCVPVLREKATFQDLPAPDQTVFSSIVAAELWAGAYKSGREHPQFARVTEFLKLFEILDFSHDAARHYGEIRAELEKKGRSIGPLDLLIAAHVRSLGATLITANAGEFKRVKGLKVLAWR
jgi:tRNA(fMet)-specific endonuclease VapC